MLSIREFSKTFDDYPKPLRLFNNFSMEVTKGEFVSILGNNGIGKTTLLNVIAGIESFNQGKILINDKKVEKSNIGYVFQNYSETLFPWMNVAENIAFPLKSIRLNREERFYRAKKFCREYKITIPLDKYPYQLSGGQKQLVAVAQSLIVEPDLLLMDEPFSSLDYNNSLKIQEKLLNIWNQLRLTTLFVSHRLEEALYLSSRVLILSGRPVKIIANIKNPLQYPRRVDTITSPEFRKLAKKIREIFVDN